ncbi:transposase [Singulisphaera sp. Ch08]|uniref:transposase n=1 Tax=Singulisphaera sp. Ch08 TaxID=3120278 RepID=UPI003872FA40
MLTDAEGIPLAVTVTGANAADVTGLLPLVDAIPDLSWEEGDKPTQPEELYADRAYDSEPHREELSISMPPISRTRNRSLKKPRCEAE